MLNRINLYVFIQILKSCTLIFFIFLSISWLLQLTRLLTLTNLIQIDILNVIYLSLFLIPNLITVITPFIIIFGILLCFTKLNKDKEIIAMYSLGLQLKPIKVSLIAFSAMILLIYVSINFYISPKIYEQYKLKEFELRNTINLEKMVISNFLKLNNNTTIDFKKNNNSYEDIFLSFNDNRENLIFAKNGFIKSENNKYVFQLNDGFKISISDGDEIEKLEFENYVIKVDNQNQLTFNNYDINTLTIFDDIKANNYINISYRVTDVLIILLIIYFFYKNNIVNVNFKMKNNILFIITSFIFLIIIQLLKNSEVALLQYILINFIIILCLIFISNIKKNFYV